MGKDKKILVAEDDKFIAHAYKNALKMEGFNVELASDGEEALAKAKTFKPDLMLLDLVMPVKNGFDTLRDLRKHNTKLPVIILSNLGQESDIKQCEKFGISDYLIKSNISMKEVISKILEHLDEAE